MAPSPDHDPPAPQASGQFPHEPPDAPHKPIPLWLGVGLLALLLFGGAAAIVIVMNRPPPKAPPNAANFVVPRPGAPNVVNSSPGPKDANPDFDPAAIEREADLPDGLYAKPGADVLVKAGEAYARIRPAGSGASERATAAALPDLRLGFFTVSELDWEHGYLSQAVRRLAGDEAYAKELGMTPDQLARLRDLPPAPPGGWPDSARQRLAGLHEKWRTQTGDARAKVRQEMIDALRDEASRKRLADVEAMSVRVTKIKTVLTPQQAEKINPIKPWKVER